jgi:hypothetical protein
MGELSNKRKWLAQCSDKELDDFILSDEEYLLDATRERDYRMNKKLFKVSNNLFIGTIVLCVLTVILAILTAKLLFRS